MARLKVASLFSGAGGLDLGFVQSGKFEIIFANDVKDYMARIYSLNFKIPLVRGSTQPFRQPIVVNEDLTNLSFEGLEADVVVGGPPCQDFSILRASTAERGGITVKRGQLYVHFVRALAEVRPKAFLFENVPGLTTANKGLAYRVILEDFSRLNVRWSEIKREIQHVGFNRQPEGYHIIFSGLVNASALGVPQARKRLIIVGIRKDLVKDGKKVSDIRARFHSLIRDPVFEKYPLTPLETFAGKALPELQHVYERIVKEYAEVAEKVSSPRANEWKHKVWKHLTFDVVKDYVNANNVKPASKDEIEEAFKRHREVLVELGYYGVDVASLHLTDSSTSLPKEDLDIVEKMKMIPPGENFEFVVGTRWELRKKGVSQIYRRLHPLKPSYTVVAYGGGGMAMYHYERRRSALTLREKARLQTFPDTFLFMGSYSEAKSAIGEAVPPLMSKRLAEALCIILSEIGST